MIFQFYLIDSKTIVKGGIRLTLSILSILSYRFMGSVKANHVGGSVSFQFYLIDSEARLRPNCHESAMCFQFYLIDSITSSM